MTEKKSHAHESVEAKEESVETKATQTKGENPKIEKKGCMDRCIENPGFPWMVIAILFTLLVMMFWREHYSYSMWRMHSGNVFYKEGRMMDDSSRPMMDDGMRGYR